jgi:hypothetical protein
MKQIFTSLFVVVALLGSTSALADDNKKTADSKTKTECCAGKEKEKACCEKEEKKECCKKKDKADKKKADAACCSEKKAGSENKSCGKK